MVMNSVAWQILLPVRDHVLSGLVFFRIVSVLLPGQYESLRGFLSGTLQAERWNFISLFVCRSSRRYLFYGARGHEGASD